MSLPVLPRFLLSNRRFVSLKRFRKFCTDCGDNNVKEEVEESHTPVMVNEVVNYLNLKEGNVLVDMTFGAGGHSSALLEKVPDLKIIALDRDPIAEGFMEELKEKYPNQITPLLGRFSDLPELLEKKGIKRNSIDGFLFDLGCSSMQFDYAERGFSVTKDGPLDMRMDGTRVPKQITAADVITYADETDLRQIFKVYGEEARARKIAGAILAARFTFKPIKTTAHLNDLVETVCGGEIRHDKLQRVTKIATKVFQALRIFVNNEINELYYGIQICHKYLRPSGRAVVISFHSLEDKVAKLHFTNKDYDATFLSPELLDYSVFNSEQYVGSPKKNWEVINKHVVVPSEEEVLMNPRSRSAKLRAAAKVWEE